MDKQKKKTACLILGHYIILDDILMVIHGFNSTNGL